MGTWLATRKPQVGTILRIDGDNEGDPPCDIPADNPFTRGGPEEAQAANEKAQADEDTPARQPVILVYGLRNAWQFSFDCETGDMYIADVGQCSEKRSNSSWQTKEPPGPQPKLRPPGGAH
jgi:hypothetical protein